MHPTHYEVLEIEENASPAEVTAAYRRLVKLWHPDRHVEGSDAGERIRKIVAAREVLCDPTRRAAYDLELANWREAEQLRASNVTSPVLHFDWRVGLATAGIVGAAVLLAYVEKLEQEKRRARRLRRNRSRFD